MMPGRVNPNCEATLSIVVANENRQSKLIDAVGFTHSKMYLITMGTVISSTNPL